MPNVGLMLEELCQSVQMELVFIAPFMKQRVMERLLRNVDDDIKVTCITRWRPDEIRIGVSDIGVWDALKDFPRSRMLLRADLHAKYYRADGHCLVGSANVTAHALGLGQSPNLELLIPVDAEADSLSGFEAATLAGSAEVDDSVAKLMRDIVEALPVPPAVEADELRASITDELASPIVNRFEIEQWLPTLRQPGHLYRAYIGRSDELTRASQETALSDLMQLRPPPGLKSSGFRLAIGGILIQMPLVRDVDRFVEQPQRFGAMTSFLQERLNDNLGDTDADAVWQTLMRWLLYFLPNRYKRSQPRHSEIFERTEKL